MSNTLKITIIQSQLHWENAEANRKMFSAKIDDIKEKVDLIILPEMFSTGFSMNAAKLAEPSDGETFQWMVSSYEKFANEIGVFDMLMSEISVEDLERASADSISFVPSPDLFKRPPSINWPELLNCPSFKRALENLFLAHSNLKRNHEEVLNEMQSFHKDFVRIRNK